MQTWQATFRKRNKEEKALLHIEVRGGAVTSKEFYNTVVFCYKRRILPVGISQLT